MDFNMLVVSFVDIHDRRVDIAGNHALNDSRIFDLDEFDVFPRQTNFVSSFWSIEAESMPIFMPS
ncbi:MAG: hypothetical protein ACLSA6_07725 [Holdemania massiliensis]